MKRAFILFQWMVILGVIAGFMYSLVKPVSHPARDPEGWHSWDGFMAISYRGITRGDEAESVSAERFAEQMAALVEAGYSTVTPEDVEAFLNGRSPLPERALLLLFEGGRKDSFLYATPTLSKSGYCATMFVPTKLTRAWGSFFLKESSIARLASDPHWRVGSMGHAAIEQVPACADGTPGHFLARRLLAGDLPETDASLRSRIATDYELAAQTLGKLARGRVTAYLYPYADSGRGAEAEPPAAEINRREVGRYHGIAFAHDGNPFNGDGSDALDLSRQRIPAGWDGQRLVRELESRRPCPPGAPIEGFDNKTAWILGGDPIFDSGSLLLPPGAWARVPRNGAWKDADLTTRVSLETGSEARVYLRWTGPRSFLCLTLDETGIVLRERSPGSMETLWRRWKPLEVARDYRIVWRVKGIRTWITLEGEFMSGAIPVNRANAGGKSAVEAPGAAVRFRDFRVEPLQERMVLAEHLRDVSPQLRDTASAVLPSWFTQPSRCGIDASEVTLLRLAADAGVGTIPVVASPEIRSRQDADALCARIDTILNQSGIRPLIDTVATRGPDMTLPSAFMDRGYKVIAIVSPGEIIRIPNPASRPESLRYLIDGDETRIHDALQWMLRWMPPRRLIATIHPSAAHEGICEAVRAPGSGSGGA